MKQNRLCDAEEVEMALLTILEAPHPILSQRARAVREDEFGPELLKLLENMAITMYAAPGVGLAAPQIGDSRRIIVADPGNEEGELDRQLYSMVNPEIIARSTSKIKYGESCLSVPDFEQLVMRSQIITVRWQNKQGEFVEQEFSDFSAIVIQHELDHLDGVTLLEHTSQFRKKRYVSRRKKRRKLRR